MEPTRLLVAVDLIAIVAPPPQRQAQEVLLIQRRNPPFAGRWALPGGFVEPDELLERAALRELAEETGVHGIDHTAIQLVGTYGDPQRDPRGRCIGIAYRALLDLRPDDTAGADDAAEAAWFPVTQIPRPLAFDHDRILADALRPWLVPGLAADAGARTATVGVALVEGHARKADGGWHATSSATLVSGCGVTLVADPGLARGPLLAALAAARVQQDDVDYVLLTHAHLDHTGLAGIFPRARLIDAGAIYTGCHSEPHGGRVPGTDWTIVPAPGHSSDSCALYVPHCLWYADAQYAHVAVAGPEPQEGVVAAGDTFWWETGEPRPQPGDRAGLEAALERADPTLRCPALQAALWASRRALLQLLDGGGWLVPGHGPAVRLVPR